jgi:hypothetical protein
VTSGGHEAARIRIGAANGIGEPFSSLTVGEACRPGWWSGDSLTAANIPGGLNKSMQQPRRMPLMVTDRRRDSFRGRTPSMGSSLPERDGGLCGLGVLRNEL